MALREEFRLHGNWLFRHRSYLPLILLPVVIIKVIFFNSGQNTKFIQFWESFGMVVSFFGLGIRIFTVGYVPKGTSGRNTKEQIAQFLNSTGIYSTVRHPLYIGNYFMWLGVVIFTRSWWMVLVFSLAYWLYYERIMYAEEEFLREKFGNSYTEWASKTPAFLPNFSKWQPPILPFSWRTVIKREYIGFCGLIFVFSLLEIIIEYTINRSFAINNPWVGVMALNVIVFLILRFLRRKRVFSVEGR